MVERERGEGERGKRESTLNFHSCGTCRRSELLVMILVLDSITDIIED